MEATFVSALILNVGHVCAGVGTGNPAGERRYMGRQSNGGSDNETIFTMETTPLKYGPGASEEVG